MHITLRCFLIGNLNTLICKHQEKLKFIIRKNKLLYLIAQVCIHKIMYFKPFSFQTEIFFL